MKTLAMIFYAVGLLADVLTTHRALQEGRKEANPILRRLLGARPPIFAAIAWRAIVFFALVRWVPMPAWAWFLFGSLFYIVAYRNARLVRSR